MKNMVSIIIPVYNTKEHDLNKCVNSILSQDYSNLEVILVDDGSTTSIGMKCDEYASKYKNITAIHKPNGGLSSARNSGQRAANGQWISFVDSDDWLEPDTCSGLIARVNQNPSVDLFVFGNTHDFGSQMEECLFKFKDGQILGNENYALVREALILPTIFTSSWGKLFRREFLEKNSLQHNERVRQGAEDLEFMVRVLSKIDKVECVNKRYYHYVMNPDSITNSLSLRDAYSSQECLIEIEKTIRSLNNKTLAEDFNNRAWYILSSGLITGCMNTVGEDGNTFLKRKCNADKYLSTDFSKHIMEDINPKKLGFARRIVFQLAKNKHYRLIDLVAKVRRIQKGRK